MIVFVGLLAGSFSSIPAAAQEKDEIARRIEAELMAPWVIALAGVAAGHGSSGAGRRRGRPLLRAPHLTSAARTGLIGSFATLTDAIGSCPIQAPLRARTFSRQP
jgi:hypothetical protein